MYILPRARFAGLATLLVAATNKTAYAETNRGVFLWGDNSQGLISPQRGAVRIPTRVPYFDKMTVKDLAVSPTIAVAALSNGKVVQWTDPTNQSQVAGVSGVNKVIVSTTSNNVIALTNSSLYSWKISSQVQKWQLDGKLGWFERFVDVKAGVDHVVALTNKGRVFTGVLTPDLGKHHGQLGIAAFPYFEPAPAPLVLHPVKLIEQPIEQIAAGAHHTLFLTERHELYGCGSNLHGQLMLPYTYKNSKVSVPTRLRKQVDRISGGAALSYFRSKNSWFAAGDGEYGQFGTGSFAHCQADPIQLVPLDVMREYDEAKKAVVPVSVNEWQVGATHVFAKMNNSCGDWLLWGSNEMGQLGNGKLAKVVKPTPVASAYQLGGVSFVAGDKISGCF